MALLLKTVLPALQTWPVAFLLLLLVPLFPVVHLLVNRPRLPKNVPALLRGLPVFGSIGFYTERFDFVQRIKSMMPGKQFTFYYGRFPIIAMTGEAGRSVVFNTRGLDLKSGFATLYAANPNIRNLQNDPLASHVPSIKKLLLRERTVRNLEAMVKDVDKAMRFKSKTVVDPFQVMYRLVYQLTHRSFGCKDVAEDEALLQRTIRHYRCMDECSPWQVLFPELPIPAKVIKRWRGLQLFLELRRVIHARRKGAIRSDDAMQVLMDSGKSDIEICSFIIELLFAGMVNTVATGAWVLCFLAREPEWYAKVQSEVGQLLAKHKKLDHETAVDLLPRVTLEEWEAALPVLETCLRETIRLKVNGTCVRKNLSGANVPIPGTKEVVPPNAFCCYGLDEVHLNEDIYRDALRWDPTRYLPDRAEDTKMPMSFLGWGAGLHPCLGLKFAKLEIVISVATIISYHDFALVEKNGNPRTAPLPETDRNELGFKLPKGVLLQCNPRFNLYE